MIRLFALSAMLCSGCRSSSRGLTEDSVGLALEACEARLDEVGAPAESGGAKSSRLEAHLGCLLTLHADQPAEGRVHAALSRALHARGLGWPDPIRDDLHAARSWALKGLSLKPRFADRLSAERGLLSPFVLQAATPQDLQLLVWGARSWARWLHARGTRGAAIDLPAVLAMATRATAVAPGDAEALAAAAMVLSIEPESPDPSAIAAAWSQAVAADSSRLLNRYDAEVFDPAKAGSEEAKVVMLEIAASTPSGRGMRRFEDELARRLAELVNTPEPSEEAPD